MDYAIGIDLGGSSIKTVAVTPAGQTLARTVVTFTVEAKMDWAEKIRQLIRQIQHEHGAPATRVGLSAPGLASADHRSIAHMPGRLQGLEGLDWTNFLEAPSPIPVLNDAHAALLGESWLGAARGFRHAILLTLGTGVGGAILANGELLHGHIGRAGHLGHVCLDPNAAPDITGMPGSLEDAMGNCTIETRSHGRFQTTHDLVAAHVAGDAEASIIWLKSVRALACAVGSFINVLDPEAVIIGGGIAHAGVALFEPLQRMLDEIEWQPGEHRAKILPAELGEFAGAYGAAARGLKELFE